MRGDHGLQFIRVFTEHLQAKGPTSGTKQPRVHEYPCHCALEVKDCIPVDGSTGWGLLALETEVGERRSVLVCRKSPVLPQGFNHCPAVN